MKTVFAFVLLTAASAISAMGAEAPPFHLSIAIPSNYEGSRTLRYKYGSPRFHVVLTNTSKEPQRIWEEWNSWGYFCLEFVITDSTAKTSKAQKKPRGWTRNWHTWTALAPGESHVFEVEFRDKNLWEGFPRPEGHHELVSMRARFVISEEPATKEDKVWTGEIASDPVSVTFLQVPKDAN